MVSRYRDIIETNQPNLSRQPSMLSTTSSVRNGLKWKHFLLSNNSLILLLGSTSETKADATSVNNVVLTSTAAPEVGI